MDPVIAQAGECVDLPARIIHSTFPSEMCIWIDPFEVSYRIGENGSICILYEYKEGVYEPWKPGSNTRDFKGKVPETFVTCKDSLCKMDYLLDPRKTASIQ